MRRHSPARPRARTTRVRASGTTSTPPPAGSLSALGSRLSAYCGTAVPRIFAGEARIAPGGARSSPRQGRNCRIAALRRTAGSRLSGALQDRGSPANCRIADQRGNRSGSLPEALSAPCAGAERQWMGNGSKARQRDRVGARRASGGWRTPNPFTPWRTEPEPPPGAIRPSSATSAILQFRPWRTEPEPPPGAIRPSSATSAILQFRPWRTEPEPPPGAIRPSSATSAILQFRPWRTEPGPPPGAIRPTSAKSAIMQFALPPRVVSRRPPSTPAQRTAPPLWRRG